MRDQESRHADPAPYSVAPPPPAGLRGVSRQYWERIAELLTARRVLTPLHLEALETLCHQWAVYRSCWEYLAADPERWITTSESGYESESGRARALGAAHKNLLRLWAHFGLTPHSEARLLPPRGPGTKGYDPAAELSAEAAEKTRHDEEHRPPK